MLKVWIFGLKAFGFLSKIASIANFLSSLFYSVLSLFEQSKQLHSGPHLPPKAKQSQYNFKHLDFLQLQTTLLDVLAVFSEDKSCYTSFY